MPPSSPRRAAAPKTGKGESCDPSASSSSSSSSDSDSGSEAGSGDIATEEEVIRAAELQRALVEGRRNHAAYTKRLEKLERVHLQAQDAYEALCANKVYAFFNQVEPPPALVTPSQAAASPPRKKRAPPASSPADEDAGPAKRQRRPRAQMVKFTPEPDGKPPRRGDEEELCQFWRKRDKRRCANARVRLVRIEEEDGVEQQVASTYCRGHLNNVLMPDEPCDGESGMTPRHAKEMRLQKGIISVAALE